MRCNKSFTMEKNYKNSEDEHIVINEVALLQLRERTKLEYNKKDVVLSQLMGL